MATLVRRLLKVLFFIGLFILAVKYIHSYPYPMPESQLQYWFSISEFLGFSNPKISISRQCWFSILLSHR